MAGKTTNKDHPFDCAAYYTITSKLSGKAVTACGDTDVRMFAPTGEDNQQWKLVEAAPGVYQLLSKATGKALDIILAGLYKKTSLPALQFDFYALQITLC